MSGKLLGQLGIGRPICAIVACAIFSFSMSQASADTIEIHFSGIDIAYDGTNIVDADPGAADPDPIITASFILNGSLIGILTTDITADLFIDDVAVMANTTVMSNGPNSMFRLNFAGGEFLELDLSEVMVTYIDSSPKDFTFTASVASAFSQSATFPFDVLFDPISPENAITLSFSAQTSSVTMGQGGLVSAFVANGTGEVRGGFDPDMNQIIPEPASIGMVILAGLMGGVYTMRKRLG